MSRKFVLGIIIAAAFFFFLGSTGSLGPINDALAVAVGNASGATDEKTDEPATKTDADKAAADIKSGVDAIGDKVKDLTDRPATETQVLLSALNTSDADKGASYDRKKQFGSSWMDPDGNGCDARNDILNRDLTGKSFDGDCVVTMGTLADSFSGEAIRFVRGASTSSKVQIDHMVPLSYAWSHGADTWSQQKRYAFANDPLNLTAVKGSLNGSKQDKGPASWMPPNQTYSCTYMTRFVTVLHTYQLSIASKDAAFLKEGLSHCS